MISFTSLLMSWHDSVDRKLPWKETVDPYKIWISEVVLQQTRVQQGTHYYLKLIKAYPSVEELASADEDDLLRLWKGLGYYSRARNMHKAAKIIAQDYDGQFPTKKSDIEKLPGIGPYTAAAISSFAYGLPYAVVDGNVYRVLSRVFGIFLPINATAGIKKFAALAQELLDKNNPAHYNQAIMDFGALCCKPKSPDCMFCPMTEICIAYQQGLVQSLPVKEKKINRRMRKFIGLIISADRHILIQKRQDKDIWQGLYSIPLIEDDLTHNKAAQLSSLGPNYEVRLDDMEFLKQDQQKLTHQDIVVDFYVVKVAQLNADTIRINNDNYDQFALPRVIDKMLKEYLRNGQL